MDEGERSGRRIDRRVPSQAVVEAVADAEGIDPVELSPPEYETLYDAIDPSALDALFAPRSNGADRADGTVVFPFCRYLVTVRADGTVTVEPAGAEGEHR